jgi:hypothetical protein
MQAIEIAILSDRHFWHEGYDKAEVGAGCGKAARPDLCGGTGVTRFPTAIHSNTIEALICR